MVINYFTCFIHDLLTFNNLQRLMIYSKFGLYLILLDKMYINTSHVY